MQDVLAPINEVAGVLGTALFDLNDQVIAAFTPPPVEPMLMSQVMYNLRGSLENLNTLDNMNWELFTASFDDGVVFLKNIDSMSLLALGRATTNPAMLAIALNVATLKIQQRAKEGPGAFSNSVGRSFQSTSGLTQSTAFSSQSGRTSVPVSLTDSRGAGGPVPLDAVGYDTMNLVMKCFVRQMGPMGKVFFKEEITRLGATASTLGRSQYDDFIVMLVSRVPDQAKRRAFLDEVSKIIR